MAMDFTTSYAAIIKQDKHDDGTMTVYGKATDDSIDMDSQICDAGWLDRAMPEWFKSGGNIREQHSNIAAGVAKEYEVKSDGHYISALVVDPVSVKKVEAGVLKGFSIGIKAPRVVRDTKAANGRIIDGQIIEVSLVDRPANPNAKLIMAKSVDGESSLIQVEELHEYKAPLPSDIAKSVDKTEKGSKMETIKQITELAKSLTPDTVKFDKDLFDTAVKAIADLIVVEAGEISGDNSERDSIESLLDALKHLRNWYQGEVEEGEVSPMNAIELSADAEIAKGACDHEDSCAGCECDGCLDCDGCDEKMCKGCSYKMAHKSASVHKCLECGCGVPSDSHGLTQVTVPAAGGSEVANVSTATIVNTDGAIKSVDPEEPRAEEPAAEVAVEATEEISAEEDSAEKSLLSDDLIETIIEKAVSKATESVKAEVDLIKSAKEAAEEKITLLETELAQAKSLAMGGAPKRTTLAAGTTTNNHLLAEAAKYQAKAAATTDSVLAKGYREIANDFLVKAGKSDAELTDKE